MNGQSTSRYINSCINNVCSLTGFEGSIASLAWAPHSRRLATSSTDSIVRLWDIETGKARFSQVPSEQPVTDFAWSPDGKTLACSCEEGTVILCDHRTLAPLFTKQISQKALRCAAWAPGARRLAIAGDDFNIYLVDFLSTNRPQHVQTAFGHRSPVRRLVWSENGRSMFSGTDDGVIGLWTHGQADTELRTFLQGPAPTRDRNIFGRMMEPYLIFAGQSG